MKELFYGISALCSEGLGGFDKWLMALICFAVGDYVTGVIKAISQKQFTRSGGLKGIIKMVLIFGVVAVGSTLQNLLNDSLPLRETVICFYVADEGLSLLANISDFVPFPKELKGVLLNLRNKSGGNSAGETAK